MSGSQSSLLNVGAGLLPKSIVRGTIAVPTGASDPIWGTTYPQYEISRRLNGVLSGACTAGTLKTILSVSGKGALSALVFAQKDATSRTHRIKITIDGTVVFNQTTAASTAQDYVCVVIGGAAPGATANYWTLIEQPIFFNSSLLVEYASSLSETDKTSLGYVYYTR